MWRMCASHMFELVHVSRSYLSFQLDTKANIVLRRGSASIVYNLDTYLPLVLLLTTMSRKYVTGVAEQDIYNVGLSFNLI